MLKISSILLFAILSFTIYGNSKELLVNLQDLNQWIGKVELIKNHDKDNKPSFVLYGRYPTKLIYKNYIPINPQKSYTLKVSFKTLYPNLPASGYMGFEVLDANKRTITYQNIVVANLPYSEVISARKGDKYLIIKMISNFDKIKKVKVAFNAKTDLSDVPNFDLSPNCKKAEKTPDGNLKIELYAPLVKDYPAGTKIRFHSQYAVPMYYLAKGWMPSDKWKECVAILNGVNTTTSPSKTKFWKGTAYVRPFVWFGNWDRKPKEGAKLLVNGFSLVESPLQNTATKK